MEVKIVIKFNPRKDNEQEINEALKRLSRIYDDINKVNNKYPPHKDTWPPHK